MAFESDDYLSRPFRASGTDGDLSPTRGLVGERWALPVFATGTTHPQRRRYAPTPRAPSHRYARPASAFSKA